MTKNYLLGFVVIAFAFSAIGGQPIKNKNELDINAKKCQFSLPNKSTLNIKSLTNENSNLIPEFGVKDMGENVVVWSDNFNDGDVSDWKLDTSSENCNWIIKNMTGNYTFTGIDADDKYSLYVEGHYRLPRETAEAASPMVTVPSNGSLNFYMGYSVNFSSYCTLFIYFKPENGEKEEIWNSVKGPQTPQTWTWREIKIDVNKYSLRKGQFIWSFYGYMGTFSLDNITLNGVAPAKNIKAETGTKISFVDLSAGEPTYWFWEFPGATPSSSVEQNPVVYYTQSGKYDVSLTVKKGTDENKITKSAFVDITGNAPEAVIIPPASFREFNSRQPFVAPLEKVKFMDGSKNYPTDWSWTFTGVSDNKDDITTINEVNPEVSYMFRGNNAVSLSVSNTEGSNTTATPIYVNYEGYINNYMPDDKTYTYDLGDGFGSFPGSNKLKITDYAEYFSKPSQPILFEAVNLYFTKAMATEVYYQIQPISVSVCKNNNGEPGDVIDSASWSIFELETPSETGLVATEFKFTKPLCLNEDFFIVISGIPELGETVDVQFSTANFRNTGNTAFLKTRDGWKKASEYFGAGKHTSLLMTIYAVHSVLYPFESEITLPKESGIHEFDLFSYFGYKTPVVSANWLRIISEPNNLTLDKIKFAYDQIPNGVNQRTANITFNDGYQEQVVTVTQNNVSGVEINTLSTEPITLKKQGDVITIESKDNIKQITIYDISGKKIQDISGNMGQTQTIDMNAYASGVYVVSTFTESNRKIFKIAIVK